MKIIKNVQPPTGISRIAFRVPIYLYRLRFGWLFGDRLLLLNHVGRISGKPRQTILEVVTHDHADDSFVVASGWGPSAAWFRNLLHAPDVSVQVGRHVKAVTAVPLQEEEGSEIFAEYAMRHRMVAKYLLPRLMGFSVDGSAADFRAVGRRMPFVRFVPRT